MNENEQIERMAESICMEYADGICAANHHVCDHNCEYKIIASQFYKKGYRKVERGEWIEDSLIDDAVICSLCGYTDHRYDYDLDRWGSKYCPECGADMRGEENER